MKVLKIIFIILGIVFTLTGFVNMQHVQEQEAGAVRVGYYIGSFLPCTICFLLARRFHRKQKQKQSAREAQELLDSLPE